MQGWGGVSPIGVGWGGSCRGGVGESCRVSNLSTNIRVQELQGTESRHVTGHQI